MELARSLEFVRFMLGVSSFRLRDKKRELLPDESDDVDKLGGGDST